jgi:hypothetical protein
VHQPQGRAGRAVALSIAEVIHPIALNQPKVLRSARSSTASTRPRDLHERARRSSAAAACCSGSRVGCGRGRSGDPGAVAGTRHERGCSDGLATSLRGTDELTS